MLHTSFCYEDLLREFWNIDYSEEQIISLVNEFSAWFESTCNIQIDHNEDMITYTEINDFSEFESSL